MKRRSSYKLTFFDKHGPEGALRLKALSYGIIVFFLALPMFGLASAKAELGGLAAIAFTLLGAATLSGASMYFGLRGGQAAGDIAQYVTAGSGTSTPYEEQFSQEQALVMQRKYAEALELFERRIALAPNEPRVRVAAADLYMTHGENPKRAAELYRDVQRIPEIPSGHYVYVTNKLADLYLGPLKAPGRALVEFRRLEIRYPGTVAARHAIAAIANLKPRIVAGADPLPPDVWDPPVKAPNPD